MDVKQIVKRKMSKECLVLTRDLFLLVSVHFDGQTAAVAAAVCRYYRDLVAQNERLALFRRWHYIDARNPENPEDGLLAALWVDKLGNFRDPPASMLAATSLYPAIMWFRHGINVYSNGFLSTGYRRGLVAFLSCFMYCVELKSRYMTADSQGNLILAVEWDNPLNYQDRVSFGTEALPFKDIHLFNIARLEEFQAFFGGGFTWRFIK